jgi:hypothetical protein
MLQHSTADCDTLRQPWTTNARGWQVLGVFSTNNCIFHARVKHVPIGLANWLARPYWKLIWNTCEPLLQRAAYPNMRRRDSSRISES